MIPLRDSVPSSTRPVVNVAFIALNVLAFLFELSLGPRLDGFIRVHALTPIVAVHELARGGVVPVVIATVLSMFLHGGWAHLLGNMLYLWIFGDNVEDALGHVGYVLFYFACGFAAAAAQVVFNAGSALPTIGASGAIAGVLGAYLVMYPRSRVLTLVPLFIFFTTVELPAIVYLGLWFVMQLFSGTLEITHATRHAVEGAGGIAWFAHAGGFICGALVALLVPRRRRLVIDRDPWRARRYGW